jgi:hypothetical protein
MKLVVICGSFLDRIWQQRCESFYLLDESENFDS